MRGKFLPFICLVVCVSLSPAATIPFSEAGKHVGAEVTVTGKVSRVSTLPSGMTFVNFGARNEPGSFTAVARPGLSDAETLKAFEGKDVEVSGTVELYKDSPQIVLKTAGSIRLPGEMPADGDASPDTENMHEPAQVESAVETFAVALDKKEIKAAGETSAGVSPENASVAIAFPKNFKPAENQRILAVFPDFFSDGDLEKLLTPYIRVAHSKGWPVITARGPDLATDLPPGWHAVMFQAAIRHLATDHPGIAGWSFYLAGNADGASRATLSTGALLKEDFDVRGCFLSSLKRQDFQKSIDTFGPSKMKVKQMKVYVSQGENDNMVSKEQSLEQTEAIEESGIKYVRHEMHEGRTGADDASLQKAFDWFEEAE